jgi:hypothetical protein
MDCYSSNSAAGNESAQKGIYINEMRLKSAMIGFAVVFSRASSSIQVMITNHFAKAYVGLKKLCQHN